MSLQKVGGGGSPSGPNPYDAARSFTESELTLTHTDTRQSAGFISLDNGSSVSRDPDDSTVSDKWDLRGVRFVLSMDVSEITATISTDYSGYNGGTAYLEQTDGTTIASTDNTISGGDTVTFNANLSAGIEYQIRVGQTSGRNTHAYDSNPAFPYESPGVDIVSGADTNSNSHGDAWNVASLSVPGNTKSSGTVIMEWSHPADIYEWDVATFTRTLDSETVDVFVSYDDGSGWTRTNSGNPISRNYDLSGDANISASDSVRIEAELSRASTSNNPTLDSAIRSWKL